MPFELRFLRAFLTFRKPCFGNWDNDLTFDWAEEAGGKIESSAGKNRVAGWNEPMKNEKSTVVRRKEPIKTEKPLQCLRHFLAACVNKKYCETVVTIFVLF